MLIILFKQGECLVSGRLEASLGDTMQFQSPNRIPDCFLLMSILGIVSAKIVSLAARLIASLPALGYTFVILTPLILKEIILPLLSNITSSALNELLIRQAVPYSFIELFLTV